MSNPKATHSASESHFCLHFASEPPNTSRSKPCLEYTTLPGRCLNLQAQQFLDLKVPESNDPHHSGVVLYSGHSSPQLSLAVYLLSSHHSGGAGGAGGACTTGHAFKYR